MTTSFAWHVPGQALGWARSLAVLLPLLAGCATPLPGSQIIEPMPGPAPRPGVTPIDPALRCLAGQFPPDVDLRLAVNDLTDGTGSTTADNALSKVLTQRPDAMMTIALAKTGVPLVNRASTGVAEWELRQSMQRYIGDGRPYVDPQTQQRVPYRQVLAGSLMGSTHYISGALTELNWNVQSDVDEVGVAGLTFGRRSFRISIAVDLIVTNSRTTEIVIARSYGKQLVGRETSVGLFRFFDVGRPNRQIGPNEVLELNIGRQANEPVQAAVRWMLETAAYDIVSELTGVGSACDDLVPEPSRPQRTRAVAQAAPLVLPERRAEAPAASPAPPPAAEANRITGVNLFDDEGMAVVRVDTQRPLERLPEVRRTPAGQLQLVFPGVRNGIGALAVPIGAGVRSAHVSEEDGSTRLEIEVAGRYTHKLVKERRSLLVQLIPVNGVRKQVLSNPERSSTGAPEAGEALSSGTARRAGELGDPSRPATTAEEALKIIRP